MSSPTLIEKNGSPSKIAHLTYSEYSRENVPMVVTAIQADTMYIIIPAVHHAI